ncbi:MotA/TolQ/ExbB proton channel family protein [Burkholderia sp. Ac-20365]|uniref:MotA/TolQ/ExbB proton channel family protein n=1 Tax=Burkholderia sp. Ac-20365 TaxID=2703897 RepID=UPI00197BEE1C|nr:MotA/TolQ/ExbB proton channel family protein [Burkholderia sp. Ac-20365]MBN3765820.1 MotA/TolQ/ExbB proton channel family protein [Burkholderia sp. Ac-20365]
MQHYGLANVWQQGDFVTRGILIALLLMSLLSWIVIVLKLWNVMRLSRIARATERSFWHAGNLEAGLHRLGGDVSPYSGNVLLALALSGKEAIEHHQVTQSNLQHSMDISDWVTRCLKDTMDDIITHLQTGLTILASIGSTAPFVGLFGTVWGIYHALIAIGVTGEAGIDRVAGPVGESLIMTAFGLFVAIPAVLGYNALTRANKSLATQLNRFAHGIHAYFVTGARPAA